MYKIFEAYEVLKKGNSIDNHLAQSLIVDESILEFQWSSLAVLLHFKEKKTTVELDLLLTAKKRSENEESWHKILEGEKNYKNEKEEIIFKTMNNLKLGKTNVRWLIDGFYNETLEKNYFSLWLMLLNIFELDNEDTFFLTEELLSSGTIIDYKKEINDQTTYFTRRYPTGGLSEKVALILPSLIAASSSIVNVKSNFLVAKTLSHTGGTVDKLSTIQGFKIPVELEEIKSILNDFNVVMSSTGTEIAPADEKLYTFRSLSGTVESDALIISSIASKQLALPTDYLLMDIRYGSGAFIKNKDKAIKLGNNLKEILDFFQQKNSYSLTSMEEPNGSSVGNIFEVAEAIEIMRPNEKSGLFRENEKKKQRELVIQFFVNIMEKMDNDIDWSNMANNLFDDNKVYEQFLILLSHHGVSSKEIKLISNNPVKYFNIDKMNVYELNAINDGRLLSIDQKKLGYITNYSLNFDLKENQKKLDNGGIVLNKSLNDYVKKGDPVATVYCRAFLDVETLSQTLNCFKIR